ncbi:hypothetical protein D3C71_1512070 [compost metagenome]
MPAKNTPLNSTPASTPRARSCVQTTTTTVASMTTDDCQGCVRRLRIEPQLNVPMDTMIMTATSAGMGILATKGPSTTIRNSRKEPATNVESRVEPPDFTLMTDWPIMAQPPMPPKKPVTKFAMPWPLHSRRLLLGVSVMSSTICAVIIDSSKPTAAMVSEYGKMICKVSRVKGTFGIRNDGSDDGSLPMSPTVLTGRPQ